MLIYASCVDRGHVKEHSVKVWTNLKLGCEERANFTEPSSSDNLLEKLLFFFSIKILFIWPVLFESSNKIDANVAARIESILWIFNVDA